MEIPVHPDARNDAGSSSSHQSNAKITTLSPPQNGKKNESKQVQINKSNYSTTPLQIGLNKTNAPVSRKTSGLKNNRRPSFIKNGDKTLINGKPYQESLPSIEEVMATSIKRDLLHVPGQAEADLSSIEKMLTSHLQKLDTIEKEDAVNGSTFLSAQPLNRYSNSPSVKTDLYSM
jgi:hypothetical protein